MSKYSSPDVHIEEFENGIKPIEGVSTSTAGFLGPTLRGPLEPRLVTSFEHFSRIYGGYLPANRSTLPFAVEGFFLNGGQRCYVARTAPGDATTMNNTHDGKIEFKAIGPGTWGNRIAVKIEKYRSQPVVHLRERFKITVMYWDENLPVVSPVDPTEPATVTDPNRIKPTISEVYDNLSSRETSIDFYETRINTNSNLIRVTKVADDIPALMDMQMLSALGTVGTDGTLPESITDYQGKDLDQLPDGKTSKSGLLGFKEIDEISIVCAPDHHNLPSLTQELIKHCTQLADRFAILHSNPRTDNLHNINNVRVPEDTSYAAFYFPWIKVFNPQINRDSMIPPSGHVAGIYAKTDSERGVHKAPANVVVSGATGLELQITKREQDILNPLGVNCIRFFPDRGFRVWGARTCSTNTLWKYVNVRRLFLFIKESIEESIQWVVFEPNDHKLWVRVRQMITQFLTTVWRKGALMGAKPEEGFFVKCNRTTMTQDDIDNGRLICIIGIAPIKPAEFIIFRVTQFTGASEIEKL